MVKPAKQVLLLCTLTFAIAVTLVGSVFATPGTTPSPVTRSNPPLTVYATQTGPYDYVAAGASMRNQGFGTVTVTWTGPLVKAYLVWSIIPSPSTPPPLTGMLNGAPVTGVILGSDVSPCWPSFGAPESIFTLAADVTLLPVVNGANSLSGFPSGITTGADPWASSIEPLIEGASLVVIFSPGGSTPTRQIDIYNGPDTVLGTASGPQSLPHAAAASSIAKTTYVVADGQLSGNLAVFNGATIDSNAFPGNDPKATATVWSFGNLHDTNTYSSPTITVATGSTLETAEISGSGTGDCLTWDAQVLRVDISTAAVPEFGLSTTLFSALLGIAVLSITRLRRRKED